MSRQPDATTRVKAGGRADGPVQGRHFVPTSVGFVAVTAFCIVNLVNALNKGGDFLIFLEAGRRFLERMPLYDRSSVGFGVIGPPFQGMFFAPFAMIETSDIRLARILWYLGGLGSLYWGIRLWATFSIRPLAGEIGKPVGVSFFSLTVLIPVLAIALPLQTNFEHQNMNPLLLLIVGGAAVALMHGATVFAGALVGLAIALKAFPALLVVLFACRSLWRAAASSILVATALTLAPALVYGADSYADQLRRWLEVSGAGGWPVRGNNQSLFAAIDRAIGGSAAASGMASGSQASYAIYAVTAALLVGLLAMTIWKRRRIPEYVPIEMAAALLLAVLLSPIAWDHYWVLLFPAFFVAYNARSHSTATRWWPIGFWVSAVLTSGLSRLWIGKAGFSSARMLSANTVAALILFFVLLSIERQSRESIVAGESGR